VCLTSEEGTMLSGDDTVELSRTKQTNRLNYCTGMFHVCKYDNAAV